MGERSLKFKVAKGAAWVLAEKLSTQVIGLVVEIVLARLLTPNDYGIVALTLIFFTLANIIVDGGFGTALIQKKDADELDFNSVFYLNIALSLVAYSVLYFIAPLIAGFYNTPQLLKIIRVSAICVIFNAVSAVQNAELTRKMLFDRSFRVSLLAIAASGVCGVSMALLGFGAWSLVISSLVAGFVGMLSRWFIIAWRPKLIFSWQRLKPLFSYGWKMAVSSMLDSFFNQLSGLLIGKMYTKADLAFVNKGKMLPSVVMNEVDSTLARVSLPALVQRQDDTEALRVAMRRMIRCSTFLVFPMMVGVACCARSIVLLLYGTRWLEAVPFMQLACFSFALWPFHTINLRAIVVIGRSDMFLKLEILKKAISLVAMLISLQYGVLVFMCMTAFVVGPLGLVINSWPNRRLLGYSVEMQIRDVLPALMICGIEALVVTIIGYIYDSFVCSYVNTAGGGFTELIMIIGKLALQVLCGSVVYFSMAYYLRFEAFYEYICMAQSLNCDRYGIIETIVRRFRQ